MKRIIRSALLVLVGGGCWVAHAQPAAARQEDFDRLNAKVAAQDEQIRELTTTLRDLTNLLRAQGTLPATAPQPPRAAAPAPPASPPTGQLELARAAALSGDTVPPRAPLSLDIGGVAITPTGFFDFSQVWRSKTVTSGLPTTFATVPYNNTVDGNRRQSLSSAAFTRMGFRVDTKVYGAQVLGLLETDFLGFVPGNVATTTNSDGLRLRLALADVRLGKWEFLGGQSWSLLTPARKGISPLPSTLFLTQDLDPNIMTGLAWSRSPGFRVVYHPKETLAVGVSFESGDAYVGGSGGSGVSTLPSALAPNYFGQVDTGTGGLTTPNSNATYITKVAWDPKAGDRALHFEAVALATRYAFFNPLNGRNFSTTGGSFAGNAGVEVAPGFSLFTNNFYGNGGGRFIFGQGPALIIRGDGSPSLVKAMSTVDGLEYQVKPKTQLFAYYGGTYLGRNTAIDPSTGSLVGYGYEGSPNSHNRNIQEIAGGFRHVFWDNPNYGSLMFNGQYSWVVRHPWYVAPGQPKLANLNMVYLSMRYVLPGKAPTIR